VKENRLNREELKELIQGIVVTTPTPFDDDLMEGVREFLESSGVVRRD